MPTAGNGGTGGTPSGGSGGSDSGGSGGSDSGGSGGSGGSGSGGSGGTGGTDPDEDGGVEDDASMPDELPMDGEALSVCESTDDCTGDELVCAVFGTNRGYCTTECQEAEDCDAVEGIEPICDSDDRCVIDCEVDGEPDGECPEQMDCVEITDVLADPIFRCQYPTPKNVEEYGACNAERGDDDCKGGLTCQMFPGLTDLREPYCTAGCEEPSDCDDMGSEATPVCDTAISLEGVCALECEEDDQCPEGLTCVFVDALAMRCGTEIE